MLEVCVYKGFRLKAGTIFAENKYDEKEPQIQQPAQGKALLRRHGTHGALLLKRFHIEHQQKRKDQNKNIVEIQTERGESGHGKDG